jgi:hypothetical protein
LGYLPFDRIIDQRNADPIVREFSQAKPHAFVTAGIRVDIPDVNHLHPRVVPFDFHGQQPFRLVFYGEKSSLETMLEPLASHYGADLFLPAGELSATLIYQMARHAADDGRPMVVFSFTDCDPAGWQMPISIGRKLQALKELLFPDLDFQVRRVGLTPEQVRMYGLPSTPLKDGERRADRWTAAMGVEQTEIDALAALRPELLRELAVEEIKQFYDVTLANRVYMARERWMTEAQEILDERLDQDELERIRAEAVEVLADLEEEIEALNDRLRVDIDPGTLPPMVIPEAEINGLPSMPLIDSREGFAVGSQRLIESKRYLEVWP